MTTQYPPVFGAARKEVSAEPIVFMVDGEAEPFLVPRPVPAFPLMDMAAEAADGNETAAITSFLRFLKGCIPDNQWGRFRDAVTRARWDVGDLLPLVQWLVQEATGRPTTPPSVSPGWSGSGGQWPNPGHAASGGSPLSR